MGNRKTNYSPNDQLYTPPEIFEVLNVVFDMDVCSPTGGLPWIPAKKFIDETEDGLVTEWVGRVWMNPPFSNTTPWMDKWLNHKNGFCLVPFSRAKWFTKLWDSEAVGWFCDYNVAFHKPDKTTRQIYSPVGIWAIGETNITALKQSGLGVIR